MSLSYVHILLSLPLVQVITFTLLKELVHIVLERLEKISIYNKCPNSSILEHARELLIDVLPPGTYEGKCQGSC
jgi:hypothetical protein